MWVQPFRADVEQVPPRLEVDHRVAVLLNLSARKVTAKVQRALSHVVPEGDLFLSRSELDARRIAQQVVDRGYHTVFLGGGDGTLTCFVNEILTQVALRRQHHPTPTPALRRAQAGHGQLRRLAGEGLLHPRRRLRRRRAARPRRRSARLPHDRSAPHRRQARAVRRPGHGWQAPQRLQLGQEHLRPGAAVEDDDGRGRLLHLGRVQDGALLPHALEPGGLRGHQRPGDRLPHGPRRHAGRDVRARRHRSTRGRW